MIGQFFIHRPLEQVFRELREQAALAEQLDPLRPDSPINSSTIANETRPSVNE